MVSALQRAGLEVPRQGEHYLTAAGPRERRQVAVERSDL